MLVDEPYGAEKAIRSERTRGCVFAAAVVDMKVGIPSGLKKEGNNDQ
ncbi:hypothetical protein ACPUYX_00815 [Desulfosporosinus sp. SYSU MS00001]